MRKILVLLLLLVFSYSTGFAQGNTSNEKEPGFSKIAPEFPGGTNELTNFFFKNIHYPEDAISLNKEGRVIVSLIIEEDGHVSKSTILRGLWPSIDAEVLRVANSLPRFKPGITDGKPVRSLFNIPVNFKIPDDTEATKSALLSLAAGTLVAAVVADAALSNLSSSSSSTSTSSIASSSESTSSIASSSESTSSSKPVNSSVDPEAVSIPSYEFDSQWYIGFHDYNNVKNEVGENQYRDLKFSDGTRGKVCRVVQSGNKYWYWSDNVRYESLEAAINAVYVKQKYGKTRDKGRIIGIFY